MATASKRPARDLELDQFEEALAKLRILYDKYFYGVDKLPPTKEHDKVRLKFRLLQRQLVGNTAWRFRLQQLQATLVTQESYWRRIVRQIEEGTYKRGASPRAAPPVPKKAATVDAAAGEILRLHEEYAAARRQAGQEATISPEALAQAVARQKKAVQEKYGCEDVAFKVVMREGKAVLEGRPVKG